MSVSTDALPPRPPLTRERVLACALAVADAGGVGSLTIRSLAGELGVKPMSVYHHVSNKDAILDGIVDMVFDEMDLPVEVEVEVEVDADADGDGAWRHQIVRRAHATRRALRRHTWAIGLLESRHTPGPATLRHHEETMRILREAGFSLGMTAHASALLDSFVCGFALQEVARPFRRKVTDPSAEPQVEDVLDPATYPHLAEVAEEHFLRPDYDFGDEFQLGLDLILGALSRSIGAGDFTQT
jgi:AcrR family transcriptional regulator